MTMKNLILFTRAVSLATIWSFVIGTGYLLPKDAMAWQVRGTTRANVNVNRNVNRFGNTNINRNVNINRDVNINRNVNIDRNVNVYGGYGYRGGYYYHDSIGVGGAVAVGVTRMAVGSIITAAALPASCSAVFINGMTYQQCGNTWYQPRYAGSQVNYIVINPPR
jgi:hypothetical protein